MEAAHLWQRADELAVAAAAAPRPVTEAWGRPLPPLVGPPDPAQELRAQATHLLESARDQLQAAADQGARVIRDAGDAAPSKSRWANFFGGLGDAVGFVGHVGLGLWDGLAGTAEFLWELSPHHLIEDPGHYGEIWDGLVDAVKFAREDFIGFGKAMLNWDQWATDPGRALGNAAFGFIPIVGVLAKVKKLHRLANVIPEGYHKLGNGMVVPDWAKGGEVPRTGLAADLISPDYKRYSDLSEDQFFERYWDPHARGGAGDWDYPKNPPHGFAEPPTPNTLKPGDVIDRFGEPSGRYASPTATPFDQRALPPNSVTAEYGQWRVLKPLPEAVLEGRTAPWFEQPGGGIQYKFDPSGTRRTAT